MGRRVKVRLALLDISFTYSWLSFDRNIVYFVPKSQNRNPIPRARCTFPPISTFHLLPSLLCLLCHVDLVLILCIPRPSLSMHSIQLPLRPHPARCPPSAPFEVQATTLWMLLVEQASLVKEGSDWGVVRRQEEG
jgi:hypothetical protein